MTVAVQCRCRVPNWRDFRFALALRQKDLAEMLGVTIATVAELEREHHCPRDVSIERLREYLRLPEMQARLLAANYPFPFPEDVT